MKRLVLLCTVVAASCGPNAPREVMPTLPGDGVANVAPPPTDAKPVSDQDPWTGRDDLIQAPPLKPAQAVTLPTVERFTLPNGLEVMIVKSDRLPTVAMQLAIRAGRGEEPLARLGVAELTANVLPKGSKKKSALAIAQAIDFVGGSITADASFEATWVSCSTLAKDTKTCLELLPEMITQPSFPQGEIDKAKAAMLADISRRLDDTGALANAELQNLLWGNDHVRGWVTSAAWINQLDRDDLIAWHKTWFVPANAQLAIAGDVDLAKLKKELVRAFGGWKKGPVPARPRYPDPVRRAAVVRLVDKPGLTQTQIRVGQLGLRHDDARFFPTLVWNYALGGGAFSSRLMTVVRSQGGKSYGASTTFDRNLERGSLVATTFTRTEETVATLKLVLDELGKMRDGGPNADEVEAAIANLAGSYALRLAGADDVAAALVTADLHGLSQRYVTDFPLLVANVTTEDAAEAARDLLRPETAAIVLVGDGAKVGPQLEAAGIPFEKVAFTDAIGPQPEVAAPPADAGKIAAAQKIIDAALVAKGGAKLAALKTLKMQATGTLSAQGQKLDVVFKRALVLPDRMRMDIELAKQFNVSIAVSGNAGWQSGPQGIDDLPASQLPALVQQRFIDPEFILLRAKDAGVTAELIGTDKVDGALCDLVRIVAPGGLEAQLLLDQKTHLLRQTRYMNGGSETRETFDDYRDVKGIQIAHHRVSIGGAEASDLKVDSVELDPAIDAKIFVKPQP